MRTDAGVFDVSHMGELEVEGPQALELLQAMLSNDVVELEDGRGAVHAPHERARRDRRRPHRLPHRPGRYLLVVNASNRETDFAWLVEHEMPRRPTCATSPTSTRCSRSRARARSSGSGSRTAKAFTWAMGELDGVEVMVNRTGYTGEEGVELGVHGRGRSRRCGTRSLARGVTPCGLGARDTLRLEVCYPLHGNDIGPQADAISGGLGWVCALDKDFTGAERLRAVKEAGPERKLVAFRMTEQRDPAPGHGDRGGGEVTSGTQSPMLDVGIGLGYVPAEHRDAGNASSTIDVRGTPRGAEVVKKPIYTRGGVRWPRASRYPDDLRYNTRARLGADRRRRGGARHHLVRRTTRSASSSTTSRRRSARRREGHARTARSSRSRPCPT